MLKDEKTVKTVSDEELSEILKSYVDHAFDVLKEETSKDSNKTSFITTALGITENSNHHVILLPWENDDQKIVYSRELGKKCFNDRLFKLAIISDAVMKTYNHKPDPITEQPLSYPLNMRKECLVLLFVDFMAPNKNFYQVNPYSLSEKKVIREEALQIINNVESMGSAILSNISYGFVSAAMLDLLKKKEVTDDQLSIQLGDTLLKEVLQEYPGATLGMNVLNRVNIRENS